MKFTNAQACNLVLVAGDNAIYEPATDAQIRALTVHNPTDANLPITINVGDKQYIKKTVTAGSTEVISQLFNQQVLSNESVTMTGEGANVLMTVVEITD